jgi:hypothetical protein
LEVASAVLLVSTESKECNSSVYLSHQAAEFTVTSHERLAVLIRKAICKKGLLTYHYEYHNSLVPVVTLSPDAKVPFYFVVPT